MAARSFPVGTFAKPFNNVVVGLSHSCIPFQKRYLSAVVSTVRLMQGGTEIVKLKGSVPDFMRKAILLGKRLTGGKVWNDVNTNGPNGFGDEKTQSYPLTM